MKDFPELLKIWASSEMGRASSTSAEDLSSICSGPMGDVWRWIIDHVKDRDEVRKIRGNLILASSVASSVNRSCTSSSFYDTERRMLLDDRSRLMGELHTVLMKVQRLQSSLEQTRLDCIKNDQKKAEVADTLQVRRQRITLLGLYAKKANGLLSKISSTTSRLQEILNRETKPKGRVMVCNETGVISEDALKLNETITNCSLFFKSILDGNVLNSKTQFRDSILSGLCGISPDDLLRGLIKHSSELCQEVSANKKISPDIPDEVEEDQEEFHETVKNEMINFAWRHASSHKEANIIKKNVEALQEKLEDAKDKVINHFDDLDFKKFENGSLSRSLESLTSQFRSLIHSSHGNDIIDAQQEQIDDLCRIISSLILRTSSCSLKHHQLKILETMTTTIPYLSSEVSNLSVPIKNNPSSQLKTLNSAPTWKLSSTMVPGDSFMTMTPTCHLSIMRDRSHQPRIPVSIFSNRQDFVQATIDILEENHHTEKLVVKSSGLDGDCSSDLKKLEQLENVLSTNIKEQSRNLIPVIDEGKKRQKKTRELCGTLRKTHEEWRLQPARDVACSEMLQWPEIEGRSLQQTLDLGKCYLNKLNM